MKKNLVWFLILLFSMFLVACGSESNTTESASVESDEQLQEQTTEQTEEKIVLKLATHEPPGAFFSSTVTEPFMERVEELTNGQVEFEFYPSQQIGAVSDYLDLTAQGVTDIAFFISMYTSDRMPYTSHITGLPGLSENSNQASKALHELIQQDPILTTDYLNNGVRPILGYATPPYDFFSATTSVKEPEDLKGKQIRSSGAFMNELIEFFGGTPVTIPTPDLYESMERGIVDLVGQYATTLNSFGLGDVIKYGTIGVEFTAGNAGFIMNEKKWQSLPENVQEAIKQAANEVVDSGSKADDEEHSNVVNEWSQQFEMYALTEDDKQKWQEKYEEFNNSWLEKQDEEFKQVLDEYKRLLEKYKE